jgi:hypothetical protein
MFRPECTEIEMGQEKENPNSFAVSTIHILTRQAWCADAGTSCPQSSCETVFAVPGNAHNQKKKKAFAIDRIGTLV